MLAKSWKIGAVALGAAAFAMSAAARDLTVVSWGGAYQDAQRDAYFKPFMQKTGTKMAEESWDGGVGTLRAKVQGGNNNWDVVQVESEELLIGCEEGLYEKLDWAKLGGKDKYMPDAVNDCGVGAIVYSFILAYDGDKIKGDAPKSWADFWNVQKWPGKRALRKGPKTTLEIALLADGVAPGELYPLDIDRALAKLSKIRDSVDVWWTGGAQTSQLLESGEVDMLPTWNGRAQTVIDAGGPVGIQWNQGLYSIEGWAIPKGAPTADLGREFIKFCADPERQAAFTDKLAYGPTNPKAYDHISAERAKDLPTAPGNFENMLLADQQWWGEHKEEAEERFNVWLLT